MIWCLAVFLGINYFSYSPSLKKMKAIRVTFHQLCDRLNLWPLLPCFPSGPGASGRLPRPVHGGWRRGPRGHQPHSETTQEGGTIISGAQQALETGVTHHTPLANLTSQCLMNRIWHIAKQLSKALYWGGHEHVSQKYHWAVWEAVLEDKARLIEKKITE